MGGVPAAGGAARQRGVRGLGCSAARLGIRRTFILHANDSKLPSDPARADRRPLRPGHQPGGGIPRDQPEAPQGDRDRGSPRPGRGAVVAALLADHAERGRTVGGEPPAHLAGARRWPDRERPGLAGRTAPCRPATGARLRRSAGDPPRHPLLLEGRAPSAGNAPQSSKGTAEITVESADRASGYWTTRSDRDPGLNARTAGVYLRADPQTSRCWMAAARRSGPSSSRSASGSGSRLRTHSEHRPRPEAAQLRPYAATSA